MVVGTSPLGVEVGPDVFSTPYAGWTIKGREGTELERGE